MIDTVREASAPFEDEFSYGHDSQLTERCPCDKEFHVMGGASEESGRIQPW